MSAGLAKTIKLWPTCSLRAQEFSVVVGQELVEELQVSEIDHLEEENQQEDKLLESRTLECLFDVRNPSWHKFRARLGAAAATQVKPILKLSFL